MAKVALICDTHHGLRNDSIVFHEYFKKSMDTFFLPYLKEHNIKHCIHLGDLVDRRKYINMQTANRLRTDFLEPMNDLGIKMHIIAGNHDEYFKDTHRVNALRELVGTRYENITCYDTPTHITIAGTEMLLIPWITKENELETFTTIEKSTAQIAFGHLQLEGFEMYRGQLADHGWHPGIFKRFDLVASGHYHHRSERDNIVYLGAFNEHTWSDFQDPRGFHIFDTETRNLEFHVNPNHIFHMISYDDVGNNNIIETIQNTDYSIYKDCYVRIVCVAKNNHYTFDMMLDKLSKEGPADISIVEDISSFTDTNPDEFVDEAQDTKTIMEKYIEGLTIGVDKSIMKNYMNEIYMEAISLESVE